MTPKAQGHYHCITGRSSLLPLETESTRRSRSRLLAAGKTLFARLGYEQTSTSAIAREAGTSESQLARYFGGKSGLLEAIFDESWKPLNRLVLSKVASAPNAREALLAVISTMVNGFGNDPELALIFMFEGRRLRGSEHNVMLSKGFLEFNELFRRLVERGQKDGSFPPDFSAAALASSLMGAGEAMVRDRLIAMRLDKPSPFSEKEIRRVLTLLLERLAVPTPASAPQPQLADQH